MHTSQIPYTCTNTPRYSSARTNSSHSNSSTMSFFSNLKNKLTSSRPSKNDQPETPVIRTDTGRLSRRDRSDMSTAKNNPFYSAPVSGQEATPQPAADSRTCLSSSAKSGGDGDLLTRNSTVGDAPPAYSRLTPNAAVPGSSSRRSVSLSRASITSAEDPYAFLSTFDTIFLIDDSGSMAGRSWREVRDCLVAITPICTSHDPDGIDVYFLNHKSNRKGGGYTNICDSAEVMDLFERVSPRMATPTGTRLDNILRPYMRTLEAKIDSMDEAKPINIIVITDGCASDDPESVIINHARKLERIDAPPHQVGIQFFQVGNEPSAAEALRNLDDNLNANNRRKAGRQDEYIRDMVDTVAWDAIKSDGSQRLSADGILKVVLGSVIRKLDDKLI